MHTSSCAEQRLALKQTACNHVNFYASKLPCIAFSCKSYTMLSVSQQASVIKTAQEFAGWCQAHTASAETWKIHHIPRSLCGVKPCCKNDLRSAQRCLCQQHLCPRVLLWDFDREVFFLCFVLSFYSFSLWTAEGQCCNWAGDIIISTRSLSCALLLQYLSIYALGDHRSMWSQ